MNDIIKTVLPWIGTALGGPLGGIAASFVGDKLGIPVATVDTVKAVLNGMSPEKVVELKSIDYAFQEKMAQMGYDNLQKLENINASVLIEVNKTMQAEAASEHWPSYSWRPFIGFMFGLYIASMFILPLFGISPVKLDADMVMAIGAILGVASYFRGKAQADPIVQNTSQITQKG
jgi:hypothetical protein